MKKILLLTSIFLALLAPQGAAAAGLEVEPTTWDVIGLESSPPAIASGPNLFPVGARICNESGADLSDLESELVWDSANSYIAVDGPATDEIGFIGNGQCRETYFVVRVQKTAEAWFSARQYRIEARASGGVSGATPAGRQLYVERLVGQNRNATQAISGAGGCNADFSVCDPAPSSLQVGQEYTYKLYSETSAPHNQLTSFITFPGTIFQVEEVRSTYEFPSGASVDGPYADACGWQPDPLLPSYLSCLGPPPAEFAPDGKAGGRMVTTYRVLVIGQGSGSLTSLINDHSGSSYHYNNDYGNVAIDFQSRYPLQVVVEGSGAVVSDPAGIDCGTACLAEYDEGTSVLLQATPALGGTFLGWGGACAEFGTEPTCTVLMNQAQEATASFSGETAYPLQVEVVGGGRVQSDSGGIDCPDTLCVQSYAAGTTVVLEATPLPGYNFVGWEEDCLADPCSVEMNGARYVRAIFEAEQPVFHTLLFREDERGSATSSSDPGQSGQILCGTECLATYPEGATVTLAVEARPGWQFIGWGDDCAGTPLTENCLLSMSEDRVASATYQRIEWPLDVTIVGEGEVSGPGISCEDDCQEDYPDGTEVRLEAKAAPGWRFVGWEGACLTADEDCLVSMTEARSVVARFAAGQVLDPQLRIRIQIKKERVWRGEYFRAELVFRNINQFTAINAQPCLRLPQGVRALRSDGGTLSQGRICWSRQDLLAGRGRKFDLLFRARSLGQKKFVAIGRADNSPTTRDRDQLRVIRRPLPHPPTG